MDKYIYRIEKPHRTFEDAELKSERNYRENQQYSESMLKNLVEAGFSYVTQISVSVSCFWYELMIETNKKLNEEELKRLATFWGEDAACTDKWE